MKASEIIELIIERHESKNDEPITMFSDLYLEPMLNYSGKMARNPRNPRNPQVTRRPRILSFRL